jgi:hypothetical protein
MQLVTFFNEILYKIFQKGPKHIVRGSCYLTCTQLQKDKAQKNILGNEEADKLAKDI